MEQLRQGQGFIDLVNSCNAVALFSGLIGLFMFVGVLASSMIQLFTAIRRTGKHSPEMEVIGRSIPATVLGVMVMIATVFSVLSVPANYWPLCALALAYTHLTNQASAAQAIARRTAQAPAPGYLQAFGQDQATGGSIQ